MVRNFLLSSVISGLLLVGTAQAGLFDKEKTLITKEIQKGFDDSGDLLTTIGSATFTVTRHISIPAATSTLYFQNGKLLKAATDFDGTWSHCRLVMQEAKDESRILVAGKFKFKANRAVLSLNANEEYVAPGEQTKINVVNSDEDSPVARITCHQGYKNNGTPTIKTLRKAFGSYLQVPFKKPVALENVELVPAEAD